MNGSLLPLFAATVGARKLRSLARSIDASAAALEAARRLTAAQRKIVERNEIFRDCHKGRAAYVIVNGPSLGRQNIEHLSDQITFVVSGFWKHPVVREWQPTYYGIIDKNFFNENPETKQFYEQLKKNVHDSTFFFPLFRGHDLLNKRTFPPSERTFYVACHGGEAGGNDLTCITQSYMSVSAFALAQAVFMGCSPIYLLGFDHDYLANRGVDRHFYRGGTIEGHKDANIPFSERVTYEGEMARNYKLWQNYKSLKRDAEAKNQLILNATDGGYLDVFPRVKFENISS